MRRSVRFALLFHAMFMVVAFPVSAVPIVDDETSIGLNNYRWNSLEFSGGFEKFKPAVDALREKNYRQALKLSSSYVANQPGDDQAHLLLCLSMIANDMDKELYTHLGEIKNFNPALATKVTNSLIDYFFKENRYFRALEFHHFVESEPLDLQRLLRKARLYDELGRLDDAKDTLQTIVAHKKDFAEAITELARMSLKEGDYLAAAEYGQQSVELSPENRKSLTVTGAAFLALGEMDQASKAFATILRLNPHDVQATLNLAVIAQISGDYDVARKHYQGVLNESPALKEALLGLAIVYWQMGDVPAFEAALTKFSKDESDPLYYLLRAGYDKIRGASGVEVKERLQRAASLFIDVGHDARLSEMDLQKLVVANFYYRVGVYGFLERNLSDSGSKKDPYLQLTLARSKLKLGNQKEALAIYSDIEKTRADMIAPKLERADIAFNMKKYDAALSGYQMAANAWPENWGIKFRLASLYNAVDQPDKAIEIYQLFLSRHPADDYVINQLAATFSEKKGDHKRALDFLKKRVDKKPFSPAILDTYAFALYMSGDLNGAKNYYEKLIKLMGKPQKLPAQSLFRIGQVYLALDDRRLAMLYYEMALDQGQRFDEMEKAEKQLRAYWSKG